MRKVSKSRADDDVISSTNGSITNEQCETEQQSSDVEKDSSQQEDDLNENGDKDLDPDEKSAKKASAKSKGKKRKSGKSKIEAEEEENEEEEADQNEDEDEDYDEKKSKKATAKNKAKKGKSGKSKHEDAEEEDYEVEKIVDSKKIKGKLHYLIRWKGYSADNDTWEPEHTVSCPDLISKYSSEKGNTSKKESDSTGKGTKRKQKPTKHSKASPKKKKNVEWDSENADENAEYEVDRILEVHHQKNGKREFLIHWKGWSSKFDSWEPEEHLNCADLIKKFMEKVESARSKDPRSLRVNPEITNRFTLQDPTTGRRLSKRRGQKQRVRYDDAE